MRGSWVGALCPHGKNFSRPVGKQCERGKKSAAPRAGQFCFAGVVVAVVETEHAAYSHNENLWVTCPGSQPQLKTIKVKTTGSQRTDDTCLPASTPEASSVDFGFRASAGLLVDTQSVRDHRRAGVRQPEASSVLRTAPELRRTSTTSVTADAVAEVRTPSRGDLRGSSLTVTCGCGVTLRSTGQQHRAPHPRDHRQRWPQA